MANPSWAYTGEKAGRVLDAELERQKANRESGNNVPRVWMPAGANKLLTFLDGTKHPKGYELPFAFMEHNLKIGEGKRAWQNWFTCLGRGCPLCEGGNKPYLATAYTVIDHTEWESKADKKVHRDEIRLFVCKSEVAKTLAKAASKRKSLRGWKCDVSRTTDKSANTGNSFDWEEKTEISNDLQPLDYMELFVPKSVEEIEKILSGQADQVDYDSDDATPVNTKVDSVIEEDDVAAF